ncbi:MAG: tRNA pseudouridine(38-40) synthase TruA [bacterium]
MSQWQYSSGCRIPSDQLLPEGIKRLAAVVEYDGSRFCGWQFQKHSPSVQAEINRALSKVADHSIDTVCAGRTDTGVHATNQIIHFDTSAYRPDDNWRRGCNTYLPDGVRIHQALSVPDHFHARFSAVGRTYRYVIYNGSSKPALLSKKASWVYRDLNVGAMNTAAQYLLGERDFSSFRAAGCQSNSPFRNVTEARVWRQREFIVFEISANAFLYHMVRNLAGALIKVGVGEMSDSEFAALLEARNRALAPATAHPDGLYLVNVAYDENPGFHSFDPGPYFIQG